VISPRSCKSKVAGSRVIAFANSRRSAAVCAERRSAQAMSSLSHSLSRASVGDFTGGSAAITASNRNCWASIQDRCSSRAASASTRPAYDNRCTSTCTSGFTTAEPGVTVAAQAATSSGARSASKSDGTYGTGSGPSANTSLIRSILPQMTDRTKALSP
jgi:hypothetical protein